MSSSSVVGIAGSPLSRVSFFVDRFICAPLGSLFSLPFFCVFHSHIEFPPEVRVDRRVVTHTAITTAAAFQGTSRRHCDLSLSAVVGVTHRRRGEKVAKLRALHRRPARRSRLTGSCEVRQTVHSITLSCPKAASLHFRYRSQKSAAPLI